MHLRMRDFFVPLQSYCIGKRPPQKIRIGKTEKLFTQRTYIPSRYTINTTKWSKI